ncbi:rab11 family-interacting protein nuf isoform 4-T4 [Cochliomyia hominivorax]
MAPMPSIKNNNNNSNKNNPNYLYATNDSADSCSTPSSPPSSTDPGKSQCSSLSDGESFEGYGENELVSIHSTHDHVDHSSLSTNDGNNNINGSSGIELDLAPHGGNSSTPQHDDDDLNFIPRDNWARMSLRRTPTNSGRRHMVGSNALANQLYRSSSFNSSGRSSNCDNSESDMYPDMEDVQNINYKLELLQRQVTDLTDTKTTVEDLTSRTKTEYAVLQARYHMLEEQFRDAEFRAEDRLAEEQKRHRELLARVEREAALQNENCQIKIKTIEIEANALREENQRLRVLCDKQASDLHRCEEKLELAKDQIAGLQQDLDEALQKERKYEKDKKTSEELMLELSKELERLRAETGPAMPTTSPETIRLEELHQELEEMRQKNRALEEQNEELQAAVLTRGVEEGRHLLNGTLNSLAQELEEMSQAQDSVDSTTLASLSQLQQAFQEKEEENTRLKHYIDTILLNIVEKCPQLLEVKAINNNNK